MHILRSYLVRRLPCYYGWVVFALVGQALGPVAAGFVFDVTGAYHQAFFGLAGVVLLGSACVLTATPPGSSEDCSA
jgi:hypothetical protein